MLFLVGEGGGGGLVFWVCKRRGSRKKIGVRGVPSYSSVGWGIFNVF